MAITREQFEQDLMEQYPELFGGQAGITPDFEALSGQVQNVATDLFPVNGLNNQQATRLSNLQAQAQDLAPLPQQPLRGSTRIPGNPYSTDISPVTNAIQQGLNRLINARRQRRLLGDPEEAQRIRSMGGEDRSSVINQMVEERARQAEGVLPQLSRLQTQQQQAQTQQEAQDEFVQRFLPNIADRLLQTRSNLAEETVRTTARANLMEDQQAFEEEQNQLDRESREKIASTRQKITGGGRSGLSSGEAVNVANTIKDSARQYSDKAQAMLEFKESWGEDAAEQWGTRTVNGHQVGFEDELEETIMKAARFQSLAAKTPAQILNAPEIIEQYDELLGVGQTDGSGADFEYPD